MTERPYTVLSCGMSLDGYLDDASNERLVLSNDADLDRVDEVRASCDAILVGAETVRADNPRLLVRDPDRRSGRIAEGRAPNPVKVTVTGGGLLDPSALFFTSGEAEHLVYCDRDCLEATRARLGKVATVVDAGRPASMTHVSQDLHRRGVRRLMVEGGGRVLTQFLTGGLADELQLVVAPFFVGDSKAKRFVEDGEFPWGASHPARLLDVRPIGDVVLLRYGLSSRCGS